MPGERQCSRNYRRPSIGWYPSSSTECTVLIAMLLHKQCAPFSRSARKHEQLVIRWTRQLHPQLVAFAHSLFQSPSQDFGIAPRGDCTTQIANRMGSPTRTIVAPSTQSFEGQLTSPAGILRVAF